MVIGAVSDEPAGVIVDVSLVDVTTEVSVVGKLPGAGVPLTAGAVVDETTEVSSVGKRGGALAPGAGEFVEGRAPSRPSLDVVDATEGVPPVICGSPDSPVRFAFSNAACWSFTCCCNVFTVSVSDCTCWRS